MKSAMHARHYYNCQVSGFEPDCLVLGRLVRLKISARTGHRYTDIYISIQIQTLNFWLPHGAWKWVESVWCFRRAALATLAIIDTAEMHRVSCASRIHLLTAVAFVAFG